MDRVKIITVFGTRPEAIKMAPLVKELEGEKAFETIVCVTAQHREMLDQVLDFFDIKPQYDLDIMKERQTLVDVTVRALEGLYEVFEKENPDMVLVHGDTSTTFVAALAAFYRKIKVGHVEAGLRSFDKYFPYPEEMNRKLTGALSDLHFAPTRTSKENLLREGVKEENIFVTGNTVIDALKTTVKRDYIFKNDILNQIDYQKNRVLVVTAHRRENWGEPIRNICLAFKDIIEDFEDVIIVYPVHLNPAVRDTVFEVLGDMRRVILLDPLDTAEMHNLLNKSYFVLTDSGGLQEEVPSLGKPVLVLRDVTERPEAVKAGTVKVIGTERDSVYQNARALLTDEGLYRKMANSVNPYGDGRASERIVKALLFHFGFVSERPEEFKPEY